MSNLTVEITGFFQGDDLEVRRTVTDLPAPISVAWLTVKRHCGQADLDAKLQKRITTEDVTGVGQIVAAGGPGVNGDLRFDLTAADTEGLGSQQFIHDIQIMLTTGKIYTIEKGTVQLTADVTGATT